MSVLPPVVAINCTAQYLGSVPDSEMFRKNKDFHEEASQKVIQDLDYDNTKKPQQHSTDYWATIFNKKCQGAAEDITAFHPTPTSVRRAIRATKIYENEEMFSDWVIAEKDFGRMTSLHIGFVAQQSLKRASLHHIFKICFLTNCHIKHHLLGDSDGQQFMEV